MARASRIVFVLVATALAGTSAAGAYPWPVKPFGAQHAIRGGFDDPRSLRGSVDPTVDNPLSFHDGVDIQAPDGSPVYAVAPGFVSSPAPSAVAVSAGGVTFGYWHVVPVVGSPDYVARGQLLGYVRPGAGHVHLAEKRFGGYVNPVRRGGLAPYHDRIPPVVNALVFYRCGTGDEIVATAINGCVDIAVDAYDPPSLTPKAPWSNVVLAPSRITWSGLFSANSWRPVGFEADEVNFTRMLASDDVRDVYGPGTRQNQAGWTGDYRFRLAQNVATTLLGDGAHVLWVTATDVRGNATTRALTFTVANEPPAEP
jgi:hypothetical protein